MVKPNFSVFKQLVNKSRLIRVEYKLKVIGKKEFKNLNTDVIEVKG